MVVKMRKMSHLRLNVLWRTLHHWWQRASFGRTDTKVKNIAAFHSNRESWVSKLSLQWSGGDDPLPRPALNCRYWLFSASCWEVCFSLPLSERITPGHFDVAGWVKLVVAIRRDFLSPELQVECRFLQLQSPKDKRAVCQNEVHCQRSHKGLFNEF